MDAGRMRSWVRRTSRALAACVLGVAGCAASSPAYRNQRVFGDPTSAVDALAAAAGNGDSAGLEAIFGPEGREVLSSGDPVADRRQREVFVVALSQGWSLVSTGDNAKELVIGHEQWPFPIPLVKDRRGWWFDTAAGKHEVLARRIGRNELAAIGVLRTYGIAQRKYASEGRDGKPAGIYARKVRSEPGKHDGLFWPMTAPGEKPSPLGDLAAEAAAEGYSGESKGPTPFHGYFYRVLTRQGKDAPGGAKSYVVGGDMKEGFAMVAHPAEYGNSGIMTFQVGPDGTIYESDLGEDTAKAAAAITEYSPDSAWHKVE
jgi:hypothetical protein